jgi:hypothetical protein
MSNTTFRSNCRLFKYIYEKIFFAGVDDLPEIGNFLKGVIGKPFTYSETDSRIEINFKRSSISVLVHAQADSKCFLVGWKSRGKVIRYEFIVFDY